MKITTTLTITLEPAEEGGYTAHIEEIPGAISEGDTFEQAYLNVLDAASQILATKTPPTTS